VMTKEIIDVLERAHAAIWDKFYGKGLSVEYTRAMSTEIHTAIAALRAQDAAIKETVESLRVVRDVLLQRGNREVEEKIVQLKREFMEAAAQAERSRQRVIAAQTQTTLVSEELEKAAVRAEKAEESAEALRQTLKRYIDAHDAANVPAGYQGSVPCPCHLCQNARDVLQRFKSEEAHDPEYDPSGHE